MIARKIDNNRMSKGRRRAHHSEPVRSRDVPHGRASTLWIRWVAIALLGVAAYWNSFGLPMVFDDRPAIERNQTIRDLSQLSEVLSPPQNTPVAGRPIVNLSLAVNYAIGGLDPTNYHLWNVSVHIACALLLFALVRRTFRGPRLQARFAANADGLAFVAALLWMVHPLQTEVVDYLSQRSESMMAFLLLLTLYCAVRARGSTRPARFWRRCSSLRISSRNRSIISASSSPSGPTARSRGPGWGSPSRPLAGRRKPPSAFSRRHGSTRSRRMPRGVWQEHS